MTEQIEDIINQCPHIATTNDITRILNITKRKIYKEIRTQQLIANPKLCQNGKVHQYYLQKDAIIAWLMEKNNHNISIERRQK